MATSFIPTARMLELFGVLEVLRVCEFPLLTNCLPFPELYGTSKGCAVPSLPLPISQAKKSSPLLVKYYSDKVWCALRDAFKTGFLRTDPHPSWNLHMHCLKTVLEFIYSEPCKELCGPTAIQGRRRNVSPKAILFRKSISPL